MRRLAINLLNVAKDLADTHGMSGRPQNAKLRRSISTAYYSLFSLLVEDAAIAMVGSGNNKKDLRGYVMRAISHEAIRDVCKGFANKNPDDKIKRALGKHVIPDDLVDIATICHDRQYWRHEADYNFIRSFSKTDAENAYEEVERAHRKWQAVKDDEAIKVFLAALVVYKLSQKSGSIIKKPQ